MRRNERAKFEKERQRLNEDWEKRFKELEARLDGNKPKVLKREDFKSDEDEAFAVLDMTQTHETVESAKRGMQMTKGRKSVVFQDEFKMKKPSEIYWFAQTHAAIKLAQDGMSAVLELGGERMLVVLTQAPAGAKLSVIFKIKGIFL